MLSAQLMAQDRPSIHRGTKSVMIDWDGFPTTLVPSGDQMQPVLTFTRTEPSTKPAKT